MAILDVRGFNLQPNVLGRLALGQQQGRQDALRQRTQQINQLLGQAQSPGAALSTPLEGETPVVPEAIPTQADLINQARAIDPVLAQQQLKILGLDDPSRRAEASRFAAEVQSLPPEMQDQRIRERAVDLRAQGRDPSDTEQLLNMTPEDRSSALTGVQLLDLSTKDRLGIAARRGGVKPAGLVEFEALTEGLSPEDTEKARKIKLGLEGRAVGSALQTITDLGTAEEVGTTSSTIKQREEFGKKTGVSRANAIDKGFERIQKVNEGLTTIDRAIKTIESGAGTGAINRFLPSIRQASIELDQIRNQLALDVIGGVTLGAISEKELDLAKQVALPTGLNEEELIQHLKDRKAAQEKLRAYFQEQVDFLEKGGTVAGFLRSKSKPTTRMTFDAQGKRVK